MRRAFKGVSTLEELKKLYKELAFKYHPDKGGDVEIMKEINNLYDEFFLYFKNTHKNKAGEFYQKETSEVADDFKDIINQLMKLKGVEIEIIGSFIWVGGNTKPYKTELKSLGFRWHSKKKLWYKSPIGYKKFGKKDYSIEEIRDMYGSSGIYKGSDDKEKRLNAGA